MILPIDNTNPRNSGLVRRGGGFRATDTRWSSRGITDGDFVRQQRVAGKPDRGPAVVEVSRVERQFDKPISGRFGVYQQSEMQPLGQYVNTWV